jgi:thiol-disulfide isomerase/thioredoxin
VTLSRSRSRVLLRVLALTFAAVVGMTRVDAAEPDTKARQLLDEVVKAYKEVPAYSDTGEFVLAMTVGETSKTQRLPLHLTLVRPNKLNIDTGLARVVSDGKTLTTIVSPLQKYSTIPAPGVVTFKTVFSGGPISSALFGGPSTPMMVAVMNLLVGDDAAKAVLDLGETLTIEPDRDLDGKPSRVLKVASTTGPSFLLLIDPETKLLRAIELTFDSKALADSFPPGQKVKIETDRWTAGSVSTTAPGRAVFAFEPPKGFTRFDEVAKAAPNEDEPKSKLTELIGKPAPDFTLTVLDGEGKTRTLSKADLAGKVVVLDFWATWCEPCLAELPEVQKLIESYAKAGKDVVFVALSQDDDPKEPAEVRKLIEATLKKNKIDLTATPLGKIALDPSTKIGEAFQVVGFPTIIMLDREGIVRAVHDEGFSLEFGKLMTKDIDALLERKPLGKDKAEEKK